MLRLLASLFLLLCAGCHFSVSDVHHDVMPGRASTELRVIRAERIDLLQRIVEVQERRLAHVRSLADAGRAGEEDVGAVEMTVFEARLKLLDAREHAAVSGSARHDH